MSDSPRSERFDETRYSTPVSELDDHRFQPSSLPRADTAGSNNVRPGTRRGTFGSIAANEKPDLLNADDALRHGMTVRDFEHAIAEDDESVNGAPVEESKHGRRGSVASRIERRNTFRRTRQPADKPTRSRGSSTSSRSVSPPNSVDAFAEPRRRERANTANTEALSELNLALHRTISGGTHGRRPTFSEFKENDQGDETASRHSSAEDDVCFPPPEENSKTYTIDFEELEEFVAESQAKTPVVHNLNHQPNIASSTSRPRVLNDLRPKSATSVPRIVTTAPTQSGHDLEAGASSAGVDDDVDEKPAKVLTQSTIDSPETINRWTFFSSELDDTIHAPDLGGLLMPGETFRDLFELGPEGGVWWLDMLSPTEEEVYAICKAFGVHPLTREDIFTQETREKVELFKSYYFVCFRSFYQVDQDSEDFMEPVNVYAVVFREGLLTFTFCANPHASNVRKRIGRLRDYVSLSADWICYALIDDIVDTFGPVIRDVEHQTDAIEDEVFTARAEDSRTLLRSIGDCRKKVMSLLRLLGGKADVIKGFAKRCNEQYSVAPRGDVGLYLSDIQDHVVTMMSNLAHFEKMLSRSHSNYLAQISVEHIATGNEFNSVLGKITLIATILVPLNLVTGLFGMNVPVPGKDSGGLGWFFGILGVIAAFVVGCLAVAKRMRYI